MPANLTDAQIADLRSIDSATIANAIEPFGVRDRTQGYLGLNVRSLFPDYPEPMVGYAVTVKGDSTTYARERDATAQDALWELIEKSPNPTIMVIQDTGNAEKSCHCGDVMCTILKELGGIGVVTNGGVRDLKEVKEMGIYYFARGVTVSHGTSFLFEPGAPTVVDGVPIKTGDLLHGDENGVVIIPDEIADKVADAGREVLADEAARREFARQPGFTAQKYREYSSDPGH